MQKPTILVVDDDRVSLTLLGKLVEKLDYNVILAEDGEQAMNALEKQTVDLIVADYDMPRMNGLELLASVKEEFPKVPFILVTAYSNTKVIREAWQGGAFDFFQKPVFVDRLNQTIRLAVEFGHLTIARREFPKPDGGKELEPDVLNIGIIRELAVALEREDLAKIVEEFDVHAHVQLEQMLRFKFANQYEDVRAVAHRLAGTAVNLGLLKFTEHMRAIEKNPEAPIPDPAVLEDLLVRSVHWLHQYVSQMFEDLAAAA